MMKIGALLKNEKALYSISALSYNVCVMLANLLATFWLDPEELGLWQSLFVITTYATILQLGTVSGLNRQLPYLIGKGDIDEAMELNNAINAFSQRMTLGIFVLGILVATGGFFFGILDGRLALSIAAIAIITSSTFYRMYINATIRSGSSLFRLTPINLVLAVAALSSVLFAFGWGYTGFVVAQVVISLLDRFLTYRIRPFRDDAVWNSAIVTKMVQFGLPLYVMGYLTNTARTIPRMALLYFGGVLLVGYFALANALLSFSRMIPTIFSQFVYPAMSYTYGSTNNKKLLWPILRKYLLISVGLGIFIGIAANSVLPWFVTQYLPKYTEGILPLKVVSWATVFSGSGIAMNALFAVNNKKLSGHVVIISLGSLALFSFALPLILPTLIGISIAVVSSEAIIFFYTVGVTYRFLMQEETN